MKAYTTLGDGIAALKREERPTPQPERNEVLLKMTVAALNYRDLLLTNGIRGWKPKAPRIRGFVRVGEVVGVGGPVTRCRTGEGVAGIFNPHWLDGEGAPAKMVGALGSAEVD